MESDAVFICCDYVAKVVCFLKFSGCKFLKDEGEIPIKINVEYLPF